MNRRALIQIILWLLIAAALWWCASCVPLDEQVWTERIERPSTDAAVPLDPPWDTLPAPHDHPLGK